MSVDATFFEETPFFSSPMQDSNPIQQVLRIPSFNPIVSPTYKTSNQEENQNHSLIEVHLLLKIILQLKVNLLSSHLNIGHKEMIHYKASHLIHVLLY